MGILKAGRQAIYFCRFQYLGALLSHSDLRSFGRHGEKKYNNFESAIEATFLFLRMLFLLYIISN